MEARQQRIADMVKDLLPCIEACKRKQRIASFIIAASVVIYAMLGGYIFNEMNRTLNVNEYATLSSMIEMSAQQKSEPAEKITGQLLTRYHLEDIRDLKARHWNDALRILTTK